jgi:hypothetical protein
MKTTLIIGLLASTLMVSSANAQTAKTPAAKTPGFNQTIPQEIMTPDAVETRIGSLKFFDGFPDDATTQKLYDNLDFMRGVEVFLNLMPAASMEALRMGNVQQGAPKSNQALIFDQLLDSNPLMLTGNTDTVYLGSFLDLETDGPTVIEIPAKCGPGTVNDAFFRYVTDVGAPGPDAGEGGKYLIVPTGYKGELPKDKKDGGDYWISYSPSKVNWVILRGFLVDGKPDASSKSFRDSYKVYSLAKASFPPKMEFVSASKIPFNTVHANSFQFFDELNAVIQREPLDFIDAELRGLAGSIGIIKGQKFAPDDRMKKTLTDAVAVGNATARALAFRTRDKAAYKYPNSQWKTAFVGNDYLWLNGDGMAGRNLDARTLFFYVATVNTPKMAMKLIGKGSQYAYANTDKDGKYLDGGKNYQLHIPANVPAADFWSVVAYDPQTRSELQTSQPYPSKNNKRDQMTANTDGSIDLYFGPKAPAGKEANWIATMPGKGWFTILRLYGPLDPWYDKLWQPGEIVLMP